MSLSFKDVSIVIQGPILDKKSFNDDVIKRYRSISKDLEIIVSTWYGTNYESNEIDKYIESSDPGALVTVDKIGLTLPTSRLIVSSLNGLKAAERKWVLKVRSDMYFTSLNWLSKLDSEAIESTEPYGIFRQKVIISTLFTPNPIRQNVLFHPSDWLFFGLRSDLLDYFSCSLPEEPLESRFFADRINPRPENYTGHRQALSRYTCEQYPLVMLMKKKEIPVPTHGFEFSPYWLEIHNQIFLSNFVLLSDKTLKYNSLKHGCVRKGFDVSSMYTELEAKNIGHKKCLKTRLFDFEKYTRMLHSIMRLSWSSFCNALMSFW